MYSQPPHYVEVHYAADSPDEQIAQNDITVSSSDDGSVVYLTDLTSNIDPLPPSNSSYQPCLVVDSHHATCRWLGPPSVSSYAVDSSSVDLSLGHDGPDKVQVLRGGMPLKIMVNAFGPLTVDVPQSVWSFVSGGQGDMSVNIGRELQDGGAVVLGWGKNRVFTYNHAVDRLVCGPDGAGSLDQKMVVDATDDVGSTCGGDIFRFP
jgi:hypothetical protein